jgi:flagellar capping protein FliD
VDPGPGDDPLDANTLRINEAEFQDALENNLGDVREVFSFQADVSGPATFLGFSADTEGVDANVSVTADAAGVTGVSVGPSGAESPVAFEVSGRRLEIQSGELEGLSLFLDDPTQSADIAVSTDTGIASDAFFRAERLSDNDSFAGAVQSQIDSIQGREGSILSGTLERLLDAQRDAETRALEDRQELLDNFLQLESDLLVLSSVNNLLSGTFNTARRGF